MTEQAYTLARYRVRAGAEAAFLEAWNALAATFASLPEPPVRGTLLRHRSDRTRFYSFVPSRSASRVQATRENAAAGEAFARWRPLCEELTTGDYEVVRHVDVGAART